MMRKLVEALTALMGLAIFAGAFNMLILPMNVFYLGLSFWQAVGAFVLSLVPGAVSMGLGVYLIRDRKRVAAWYIPADNDPPVVPVESLLRAGLVLLGIYLIVQAGPALLALMTSPFANWLQLKASEGNAEFGFANQTAWEWLIQSIPRAVSSIASLTIGVLLVTRREQIVRRVLGGVPVPVEVAESAAPTCPNCGFPYDPDDYAGGMAPPLCTNCKEPLDILRT
jgi:hypothetical protein